MIALVEDGPRLEQWLRVLVVLAGVVLVLVAARRVIDARDGSSGRTLSFGQQLTMLGLSLVSLLAVVIALPVDVEMRGQILSFLGILLSAAVALSSTTLLGNAMAGLTLRAVRGFRVGDFIQAGEHFGRVTEQGLVHTEIQTEDRDLTTLPNLFLATQPVKVIRPSGTILSAQVSLGYDVPRARAEELLKRAGDAVELEESFVSILDLGDHAVTYRLAGLCTDVPHLISRRSKLRAAMLDSLHEGEVEIVSPMFLNTRNLTAEAPVIPEAVVAPPESGEPEAVIFDKADEAATRERIEGELAELAESLAAVRAAGDEDAVASLEARRAELQERAAELKEKAKEED